RGRAHVVQRNSPARARADDRAGGRRTARDDAVPEREEGARRCVIAGCTQTRKGGDRMSEDGLGALSDQDDLTRRFNGVRSSYKERAHQQWTSLGFRRTEFGFSTPPCEMASSRPAPA